MAGLPIQHQWPWGKIFTFGILPSNSTVCHGDLAANLLARRYCAPSSVPTPPTARTDHRPSPAKFADALLSTSHHTAP